MLILGRRLGEAVQLGTDVEIRILDIQAGMVRLGINAPRRMQIWRKEVWDGVVEANRRAVRAARLFAEGALEMPRLPVSAFSGLSRAHAVRVPGSSWIRERGDVAPDLS